MQPYPFVAVWFICIQMASRTTTQRGGSMSSWLEGLPEASESPESCVDNPCPYCLINLPHNASQMNITARYYQFWNDFRSGRLHPKKYELFSTCVHWCIQIKSAEHRFNPYNPPPAEMVLPVLHTVSAGPVVFSASVPPPPPAPVPVPRATHVPNEPEDTTRLPSNIPPGLPPPSGPKIEDNDDMVQIRDPPYSVPRKLLEQQWGPYHTLQLWAGPKLKWQTMTDDHQRLVQWKIQQREWVFDIQRQGKPGTEPYTYTVNLIEMQQESHQNGQVRELRFVPVEELE